MLKYVLKRVGLAFITTFIIISLTFFAVKALKEDPPIGMYSAQKAYCDKQVNLGYWFQSRELLEGYEIVHILKGNNTVEYFYKVPIYKQYFNWLENIVTKWEWGTSLVVEKNVEVTTIIGERILVSMRLNVLSTLLSVPIGILLGIWAALKKNTITDHIISTAVMIFISIPSFVIILLSNLILGYKLSWIPTKWPNPGAAWEMQALGYLLPIFCLSFGSICGYCRFVRAELCEVMESDYLLLARTKGLTRSQAIVRHALRNAMVPIFPSILAEIIGLLGGSMMLERLYGIPGIGSLFTEALTSKDYNVLFVDMSIFTTISLLSGVVLDLSYGFIDPRIRMGAKK